MSKEQYRKKWYKYIYRALKTRNPNMRKFFEMKAKQYALLTMPTLKTYNVTTQQDVPRDRYGALRDKMLDE